MFTYEIGKLHKKFVMNDIIINLNLKHKYEINDILLCFSKINV